jgi:chemotaxis protein CheX
MSVDTSTLTELTPADLQAVVEEVWATFLGEEEPLFPALEAADPAGTTWSAAVTISGGWQGMVTVRLPEPLARILTQQMLGTDGDPAAGADEDLVDATGELVNVIGGNVKSLVPGPSTLSLPVVAPGRISASSELPPVAALHYSWSGQPVTVEVVGQPTPREPEEMKDAS